MSNDKYILERSLLRRGDIVLTRAKTLVSAGIRLVTLGKFSHAAIYIGGTTIEATLKGVFSKNPQRLVFDRAEDVAIYRSKRALSENEIDAICSHAQSKVGSLYALDEALTIRARTALRLDEKKRQFCSRLVANAYASIEYDFINLRNPAYCTPKQLALCKAFMKIEGAVRLATDDEIAFSESPDPALENLSQTYYWLNKVRALATTKFPGEWDVQTINDVTKFVMSHPELDSEISSYVRDSGYLEFFRKDEEINPHRYHESLFLAYFFCSVDPGSLIEVELEKEDSIVQRFSTMLESYIKLYKEMNLQFLKLHVDLYMQLVKQIHRRVAVIRSTLERTGNDQVAADVSKLVDVVAEVIRLSEEQLSTH